MSAPPKAFPKFKDYIIEAKIGQGSFGQVYRAKRKDNNQVCVIKTVSLDGMNSEEQKEATNEVQILKSLNFPFVIKYFDSFFDTTNSTLNIAMEYAANGTLHDKLTQIKKNLSKMKEDDIWKFFVQTCVGLYFIHKKRILHRDLKTMNIFLDSSDNVRIGDFGVSKVLAHTKGLARTFVGTPYYLSPELCENKPYNSKSDVWALGCILYELCSLKHPFDALNQAALILKIIKGKMAPLANNYSAELNRMSQMLLNRDTDKRPTTLQILKDPFVLQKGKELSIQFPEEIVTIPPPKPISWALPSPTSQSSAAQQQQQQQRAQQEQQQKMEEDVKKFEKHCFQQLLPPKPASPAIQQAPASQQAPVAQVAAQRIFAGIVPQNDTNLFENPRKPAPAVKLYEKKININKEKEPKDGKDVTNVYMIQKPKKILVSNQKANPSPSNIVKPITPKLIQNPQKKVVSNAPFELKVAPIKINNKIEEKLPKKSNSKPKNEYIQEIEDVKNLPTTFKVPVQKSEKLKEIEARIQADNEEKPIISPENMLENIEDEGEDDEEGNYEIHDANDDNQEDQENQENQEKDEDSDEENSNTVVFRVVDNRNIEKQPKNETINMDSIVLAENENEKLPAFEAQGDDFFEENGSSAVGAAVKHPQSKPRQLNRIYNEIEELEVKINGLEIECAKVIGLDKTKEIIVFLNKLGDDCEEDESRQRTEEEEDKNDTQKNELITKFVLGRIPCDHIQIIDNFWGIVGMQTRKAELEKQAALLLVK